MVFSPDNRQAERRIALVPMASIVMGLAS